MTIYINNKEYSLTDGINVTEALQTINLPAGNGTALAVNSNVIPRADWSRQLLHNNDKIMIIKATQGG